MVHKAFKLGALLKVSIAALLVFPTVGSWIGCGKRKPPLPPIERVQQHVDISGVQVGNSIILSWRMPPRNASKTSSLNISRADVYRLVEPLNSTLSLDEEEFAANSTLIASIPIKDSDFALSTLTHTDTLRFSGQQARLRYAIRFVNASGQKAAFSNFFLIEPAFRIANAPTQLHTIVTQESVKLEWTAPALNADGTSPANIVGYNIYRILNNPSGSDVRKLNDTPATALEFADNFFSFGGEYQYFVRTVSLGNNALPIESAASNIVTISPKDTFAPAPPDSITLGSAPNQISIFFPTSIEKDVVGYLVYRTMDSSIAKVDWELLTPKPITTNTFTDSKTIPGRTYYYYLTAVDRFGNVSQPSEVVSEIAL